MAQALLFISQAIRREICQTPFQEENRYVSDRLRMQIPPGTAPARQDRRQGRPFPRHPRARVPHAGTLRRHEAPHRHRTRPVLHPVHAGNRRPAPGAALGQGSDAHRPEHHRVRAGRPAAAGPRRLRRPLRHPVPRTGRRLPGHGRERPAHPRHLSRHHHR
jgi:hypothetical protein